MFSVSIDFLYALAMSFLAGSMSLYVLGRLGGYHVADTVMTKAYAVTDILFAGMITLTATAQAHSVLFGKTGGIYRGILPASALAMVFVIYRIVRHQPLEFPHRIPYLKILLFFIFAYGTSHGIEHYDTGLYHAQAIRWIAETGLIKGLGNLHTRLAYNSASFSFSAAFGPAHAMAGFIALLLAWKCSEIGRGLRARENGKRCLYLSDAARLLGIYYLFIIYDEMVSPAPDYFVNCALLYIVIAWLDAAENDAPSYSYALLCVAAVYAMTLKLSTAPLLLLTAYALMRLCREAHAARKVLTFFPAGCAVVAPFLVRNVLISGYLIYPFPAIDLFDVPWKMAKGVVSYDAKEIAVYGRGFTDVLRYGDPLPEWFPSWFSSLNTIERLMFLADMLVPFLLVFFFLHLRREYRRGGTPDVMHGGILFLVLVLDLQFLYWFFSSPLIRYGRMILFLPAVLCAAWCLSSINGRIRISDQSKYMFAISAFVLFFGYKSAMLIRDDLPRADVRWLKEQQPYTVYALEEYDRLLGADDTRDLRLMAPVTGDQSGDVLLASPNREHVELIGNTVDETGSRLNVKNALLLGEVSAP